MTSQLNLHPKKKNKKKSSVPMINLIAVRNRALVKFFKSIENLTDLNNIPKPCP